MSELEQIGDQFSGCSIEPLRSGGVIIHTSDRFGLSEAALTHNQAAEVLRRLAAALGGVHLVLVDHHSDGPAPWTSVAGCHADRPDAEAHAARINSERDLAVAENAAFEAELARLFAAEGLPLYGLQSPRQEDLRAQALATCPQTAPAGSLGIVAARVENHTVL